MLNQMAILSELVVKMEIESDIPRSIGCYKCKSNNHRVWSWHGIRLYECQTCRELFVEGEAVIK